MTLESGHRDSKFGLNLATADFSELLGLLTGSRRLILGPLAAAVVVAGTYVLVAPPKYSATCTFISSAQIAGEANQTALGPFSSAASRLGMDLRGTPGDLSPLYPWMLESREIGERVLRAPYVNRDGRHVDLTSDLVDIEADSSRTKAKALALLNRKIMNYGFDRRSGVTRITATTNDPEIAAQIANTFVRCLDEYNQSVMIDRAASVAGFLAERLADFEDTISNAEVSLRDFRNANRSSIQSPSLALEEARLIRNLDVAQQTYLNLRLQFETMKMEEYRRLPRLTVIDPAHPPFRQSAPRTVPIVLLASLLGGCVGVAFVLFRAHWRHLRMSSDPNPEKRQLPPQA